MNGGIIVYKKFVIFQKIFFKNECAASQAGTHQDDRGYPERGVSILYLTPKLRKMQYKKHIRFDWAIKRLLRQKANFGILEGFLSELLKEEIEIIEILDSESNKETEEDKHNRVDILVKDHKGELIIIEVQNAYALDYFLRILYGISKAIIEHIREGDPYSKIKKIISVNIVYFDLGHGSDYIYKGITTFRGMHDNQILELTAAQRKLFNKEKVHEVFPEMYLIKVNNFDDNAKDTLDEWIYFLKNSEIKKEFSAKGIKEANEVLKIINMTDEERREYNRFIEVLSDRASIAETIAFESELLAEEKLEKKLTEIVINLLKMQSLSDEQIAVAAKVDIAFVRKIKEELKSQDRK